MISSPLRAGVTATLTPFALAGLFAVACCSLPPAPVATTVGTASRYLVVTVEDGDTFSVQTSAGRRRVRILAINAPEVDHPDQPGQCFGAQARAALDERIRRRTVALIPDAASQDTDRYGRWLRYVEIGGEDVGLGLVRDGYAVPYHPSSSPEPTREAHYRHSAESARRAGIGLWGACGAAPTRPAAARG